MNPADRPRCVTGMPASAGAASADDTPGTTSKATPAARSASASSPPRPSTNGSPALSRTTRRPRRAARIISEWIVSCRNDGLPARLPTEKRCAWRASATMAGGTSASYSTRSAERSSAAAFRVSRPGSPGPAPTSHTRPLPAVMPSPPRPGRAVPSTAG